MDLKRIESLIDIVKDAHVSELSVRKEGSAVTVRKSARGCVQLVFAPQAVVQEHPKSSPQAAAEPEDPAGPVVTAPMVGIFHVLDGLAEAGAHVRKGQVVGAIESMKLMNDVKADVDGSVAEVYVEDGTPVEYGQVLFRLQ